jgi:Tfp pilus assembly protein PilX
MKPSRSQRGATLIITLTILVVILLLGTSSVRLRSLEEHAARNHQGLIQARLAAQAALDDALVDLHDKRWEKNQPLPESIAIDLGTFSHVKRHFDAHRLPTPQYQIERIRLPPDKHLALYRISAWGYGAGQARAALQMLVLARLAKTTSAIITLEVVGWRRGKFS